MSSSRLFSIALTATALVALGCSASTAPLGSTTDASTDAKKDSSPASDAKTDTKADSGTPTTETGSGDQCAAKTDCTTCADYETCAGCFDETDKAGSDSLNQIFITGCGCTAGATCASQCTTLCGGGEADPTCVSCLNGLTGMEACLTKVRTDCAANADCKRFLTSLQSCPE